MGIDYDFNKTTSVGINGSYRASNKNGMDNNATEIKLNNIVLNNLKTIIDENNESSYFSASAYFQKKLDTNGQELNIKGSYANFDDKTLQLFDILTDDVLTDNRENNNNSNNNIYAAQLIINCQ